MQVTGFSLLPESLEAFASNQALHVQGADYSYRDLDLASRAIASALDGDRVAILGGRSFETYAGVAAAVRSGRTYIPLNKEQPDSVLAQQLAVARPDAVFVDRTMVPRMERLLQPLGNPFPVLCPASTQDLISEPEAPVQEVDRQTNTPLYEMFTSGTTGQPKRIAISRSNVGDYLRSIRQIFDFGPDDRFSQFFELSFDLSVHDLLVAWTSGGCLVVPGDAQLIDPVRFARKHTLSVWFSVPSLARLAMMTKRLLPGALPSLRQALFCGEALPSQVAAAFAKAAPNAAITNLYGPTEATIAITWNRLDQADLKEGVRARGSVPIGRPFAGQEAVVVDGRMQPLADGQVGELLLGGSQLASGYRDAPDLTAASFLELRFAGFKSDRWYRTGDLVRCEGGILTYVGRTDTQIKFRGHRVELDVIEAAMADEAKSPLAVVIPSYQPDDGTVIESLSGLVATPKEPIENLRAKLAERLPNHMVPADIIEIPLNATWWNRNGKVDRRRLQDWHASQRREAIVETSDDQ